MEQTTDFSIYLFSNFSHKSVSNTPSDFTNKLAKELYLSGNWEVGLRQISYLNKFRNINENCIFAFKLGTKVKGATTKWHHVKIDYFPSAHYASINDVLAAVNAKIKQAMDTFIAVHTEAEIIKSDYFNGYTVLFNIDPNRKLRWPTFEIHERTGLVYFNAWDFALFEIQIEGECALWRALGFDSSIRVIENMSIAEHPHSIIRILPALFIYTSIIVPNIAGDVKAPLLSIVPIKGSIHRYVTENIDSVVYVPVSTKYLSVVDISIADMTGKNIDFGGGVTAIQLHFRKNG